jgi:hypothetical protein
MLRGLMGRKAPWVGPAAPQGKGEDGPKHLAAPCLITNKFELGFEKEFEFDPLSNSNFTQLNSK